MFISELLKLRNTLVHHIHNCVEKEAGRSRLSRLPDILTNRQICQYCPQSRNCALYERYIFQPWKSQALAFLRKESASITQFI